MSRKIDFRLKKLLSEMFFGDYDGLRKGFGGFELEEIRPFQEGDPPYAINPRLSARHGQAMVKVTRPPTGVTAHFVCDLSDSMVNKRGTLVEIVETLADHLADINALFACSLVVAEVEQEIPVGCGLDHTKNTLHILRAHRSRGRIASLESMAAVLRQIPHPPRLVFIITDLLFKEEVGLTMWSPAAHNDVIFCIIRETCEVITRRLWLGVTRFVDVETDEHVVGSIVAPPKPIERLKGLGVDWQVFSSSDGQEEVLTGLLELFERRKIREGVRL